MAFGMPRWDPESKVLGTVGYRGQQHVHGLTGARPYMKESPKLEGFGLLGLSYKGNYKGYDTGLTTPC